MDLNSDKSSVLQLDLDIGRNRTEKTNTIQMWIIPSFTEHQLRILMEKIPDQYKYIVDKHIIPFVSAENRKFQRKNASVIVLGPDNNTWKIISGHGKCEISILLDNTNEAVINLNTGQKKLEEIHCKGITKTFLGKCIIQKCGNEGSNKNESMRALLQAAIDQLVDKYDKNVLKNAKVFIYDSMATLILVSGEGKNIFGINSEKGVPRVRCTYEEEKKNTLKTKLVRYVVFLGFLGLLLIKCPFYFIRFTGTVICGFLNLKKGYF